MSGRFVFLLDQLLLECLEYIMLVFDLSVLLPCESLSGCKVPPDGLHLLMFLCECLPLPINLLPQYLDPLLSISPDPIQLIDLMVQLTLQLPVESFESIDCLGRYHKLAEDIHVGQLWQHHGRVILPIVRHYTEICPRCYQVSLQQLVVQTPRGEVAVLIELEDHYLEIVFLDLRHISCQELQLTEIYMEIYLEFRVALCPQLD